MAIEEVPEMYTFFLLPTNSTDEMSNVMSRHSSGLPVDVEVVPDTTEAAWKLARYGVGHVVSSDTTMARQIAFAVARELGLPAPITDQRLQSSNNSLQSSPGEWCS